MGAVETQASGSDFWAKMRRNENVPDSKTRVQYLLDEIALLQVKLDNNNLKPKASKVNTNVPVGVKTQGIRALNIFAEAEEEARVTVDVPTSGDTDHEQQKFVIQQDDDERSSSHAALKEMNTENELSGTNMCEDFLQFSEERMRALIEESAGFYENAEKELRVGKVDRLELTKLLQREKARLERHRHELDDLKTKLNLERGENRFSSALHDIIDKLAKFLDEREGLQLKFEVQVELGHYFRLLKLLESQKAKDDCSRRNIEKDVQQLRECLEQTKQAQDHRELENNSSGIVDVSVISVSEGEPESVDVVAPKEKEMAIVQLEQGQVDDKVDDDSHVGKKIKRDVLKLMSEQEWKWKAQLEVLHEMERRLALSELENKRLRAILKDRQSSGWRQREVQNSSPCAGDLPRGYSSIYFSPIFQERKPRAKAQHDEKDEEIQRLKSEISSLRKESVTARGNDGFLDRVQVPIEEKTISVDACSNREELGDILSLLGLEFLSSSSPGNDSEDDKHFVTATLRKASIIFQQHRDNVRTLASTGEPRVRELVERFRSLSLHIRQLSEYLASECNLHVPETDKETESRKVAELEAKVEGMNANMARAAEERAIELDRKEKTLAYAQELNLRLANDMSKLEKSLGEMRMQNAELRATSQAQLGDSKHQGELQARGLKQDILSLENGLKERDRAVEDLRSRVQACQRETDAVVQEKNEVLKRLQHVTQEVESHKTESREPDGKLEELEAARNELQTVSDAYQALENRNRELRSKLIDTEYELSQRESALERLTLHLAATKSLEQEVSFKGLERTESLRSKHHRREHARRSIQEVEEKMASMAEEMARTKVEMNDMRSQSFELLQKLRT